MGNKRRMMRMTNDDVVGGVGEEEVERTAEGTPVQTQ